MRRNQVPPHLIGPQTPLPRRGSGKKCNLVTNLVLQRPMKTVLGPRAIGYRLSAIALLLILTACMPTQAQAQFFEQQTTNGLTISLETVASPRINLPYRFIVTLSDEQGRPVESSDVYLDLDMPAMPMGTNRPIAEPEAPGRYSATTVYTMTGDWEITVAARVGGVEHRATFFIVVE
jgi:hypothetical protein